jgi:starch synthase (maltosyl-transferring)
MRGISSAARGHQAGRIVTMELERNRKRVIIGGISPEVDSGRYPVKRTEGDRVRVEADVFTDGHDLPACVLQHRRKGAKAWREVPMEPLGNDRWTASFFVDEPGAYEYTITGWVDRYGTWLRDTAKKVEAGFDVELELHEAAALLRETASRAPRVAAATLAQAADAASGKGDPKVRYLQASEARVAALMSRHAERRFAVTHPVALGITVDRERARCGSWYEMFPRSCAQEPGRHGTFRDCLKVLPYVASMGFDVLYLPPIHPVGATLKKGRNNDPAGRPDDPGSPWAIGGAEGGHKAVDPRLGTFKDFAALLAEAQKLGMEVALDVAFQCSPDHPYVKDHPEWFKHRPDGTIHYAENPPKRYEDIYPFDFDCEAWESLWDELKSIFDFWIGKGVAIFRVDNPHTKSLRFWEWCIAEIKAAHPEVIFLSEAFTRPKVMNHLAKIGFSQSYTYFTWRNDSWELREYFTELARPPLCDYYRPNLWTNTPDILHEYLQSGGRPAFAVRLVLAATLGASYGIYGPAFELCERVPREPGSEEYLNSEKYEIRVWDRDRPENLRHVIARVNEIRRDHRALQSDRSLVFHDPDNPQLLAYSKRAEEGEDVILTVVNLDPRHRQSGFVNLRLEELGVTGPEFQVEDLLGGGRYTWSGPRNYVELDPDIIPAHILLVRKRIHQKEDVDTDA